MTTNSWRLFTELYIKLALDPTIQFTYSTCISNPMSNPSVPKYSLKGLSHEIETR